MSIRIGHASIDENGTIIGRKTGDQTGNEICIRNWYGKPWNVYMECTDPAMANKAAEYMEEICTNPNYGYSQPNRWDGYHSIVKNGKDVSKGKGDFDCSSLILSCYIFAGLNIRPDGYTGNMASILKASGKFREYRIGEYISTDKYAKRGGVYIKEGSHTAMALDSKSNENNKVADAKYFDKAMAGKYMTTTRLNIRYGAGGNQHKIDDLPEGTIVQNYGYYNKTTDGDKWLLVKVGSMLGYCSANFLKKR